MLPRAAMAPISQANLSIRGWPPLSSATLSGSAAFHLEASKTDAFWSMHFSSTCFILTPPEIRKFGTTLEINTIFDGPDESTASQTRWRSTETLVAARSTSSRNNTGLVSLRLMTRGENKSANSHSRPRSGKRSRTVGGKKSIKTLATDCTESHS